MKLTDLDPQFLMAKTKTRYAHTDDAAKAQGIMFLCPVCFKKNKGAVGTHSVIVWFDGRGTLKECDGPRWSVRGSNYGDLTIAPSIHTIGGCGWHGHVKKGEVT